MATTRTTRPEDEIVGFEPDHPEDVLSEPAAAEPVKTVQEAESDEPAPGAAEFTLVQHHDFVFGGDPSKEDVVQVVPVRGVREAKAVEQARGLSFRTYAEALDFVGKVQDYVKANGELAGYFHDRTVGGAAIYVPLRAPIA